MWSIYITATLLTLSIGCVYMIMGLDDQAYASETYNFRQVDFEKGSECAEYFIIYHTSQPYDYMVKVPALLKFDKGCNPIAP